MGKTATTLCSYFTYFFWQLVSGTKVAAHYGPTNIRLRCHLPLQVRLIVIDNLYIRFFCPSVFCIIITCCQNENQFPFLFIPQLGDYCHMSVDGIHRCWVKGRCLLFDDFLLHSAHNESVPTSSKPQKPVKVDDEVRIVLLLDFWQPQIDEQRRTMLARLFHIEDISQ